MVDFTPVQFDFSIIANVMNAKIAQQMATLTASSTTTTSSNTAATSKEIAVGTPPWRLEDPDQLKLARSALKSGAFIPDSVSRKALAADEDTPKLFAAYDALATMKALADSIVSGDISDSYRDRATKRLNEGFEELQGFLKSASLQKVTLLQGDRLSRSESDVAIKRSSYDYTTRVLHTGDADDPVAQWAGLAGFDISVDKYGTSQTINIDLSSLADADRTLQNVVDLINTELESAGLLTRFDRTKIGPLDDNGIAQGDDWGLKVKGSQAEKLSFSTSTSAPAAYLVGASGARDHRTAQLSKWTDLETATPNRLLTARLEADEKVDAEEKTSVPDTRFLATASAPDGSVYALMETKGDLDGQQLRGEQDLALVKMDSTGQQVWSRMLGAGEGAEITGATLAVAADGRIAIGGAVEGDLTPDATGDGKDGFVLMYDATGQEVMARQQGSVFDDEVTSLAFDSSGNLFIGGRTNGALGATAHGGGVDAYVEKLDASGAQLWHNQWGGTGDEIVTALTVDDTGAAVAATIVDGEAIVRRVSDATFTASDWSHSVGDGNIRSLDWDAGALYAAGETNLDGFAAGQLTGSSQVDADAFAMRLDVAGVTVSDAWFQRFGGAGQQSSAQIMAQNGQVYVAGTGETGFGSAVVDGDENGYLTALDSATGAEAWSKEVTGYGGVASATGIAISANGDSDLDAFGLPAGDLTSGDTSRVTDRTSARPGDHFYISVDGGHQKKIEVETGDTYRALTFKINAAIVLDGKAEARRKTEGQVLRITPNENVQIELFAGAEGSDLLSALKMPSGVLINAPSSLDEDTESDGPPIVAMSLKSENLSLADDDAAQSTADMLDTAMRALRKAYRYAIDDPTLTQLKNSTNNSSGSGVSAYQQTQLANLQAGLQRLQSGSSSSSLFV